jgi:hypothetical protein
MNKWEIAEVAADQAALNVEYYAPNDLNKTTTQLLMLIMMIWILVAHLLNIKR